MKPLWKVLETGPEDEVPDVIYVIVEIPKGCKNKYEVDKVTGAMFLDKVLFTSMVYPGDYGSIPKTMAGDRDPIDALVLVSQPNYPGTIIPTRPVALLRMEDEEGVDDKVIGVPVKDPRFDEIQDLKDLPKHVKRELVHFFERVEELEPNKWTKFKGWGNQKAAKKIINRAIKLYKRCLR